MLLVNNQSSASGSAVAVPLRNYFLVSLRRNFAHQRFGIEARPDGNISHSLTHTHTLGLASLASSALLALFAKHNEVILKENSSSMRLSTACETMQLCTGCRRDGVPSVPGEAHR